MHITLAARPGFCYEQIMNKPTPPLNLPDSAPELALRFGAILAGLVGLVARRFLRMPHLMVFTLLLCARLGRMARRFARLMTRPTRTKAARVRTRRDDSARVRSVALPSRRGWLVRELGYEAAGYGAQLEHLLTDPGMQELLARVPGIGRILRPVCRMLGVAVVGALVAPIEITAAAVVPPWVSGVEAGGAGVPGVYGAAALPG